MFINPLTQSTTRQPTSVHVPVCWFVCITQAEGSMGRIGSTGKDRDRVRASRPLAHHRMVHYNLAHHSQYTEEASEWYTTTSLTTAKLRRLQNGTLQPHSPQSMVHKHKLRKLQSGTLCTLTSWLKWRYDRFRLPAFCHC